MGIIYFLMKKMKIIIILIIIINNNKINHNNNQIKINNNKNNKCLRNSSNNINNFKISKICNLNYRIIRLRAMNSWMKILIFKKFLYINVLKLLNLFWDVYLIQHLI